MKNTTINQITLRYDLARIIPAMHESAMNVLIGLGYEFVAMSEVPTDEEPLTVPNMYGFHLPDGATIHSLKVDLMMSRYCWINLTGKNFGTVAPKGPITVGFYDMKGDFMSQEAIDTVSRLAQKTGRKFRVGTPFEMIAYYLVKNKPHCPKSFVALGKIWENLAVCLRDDLNGFILGEYNEVWPKLCQVFIVEDL